MSGGGVWIVPALEKSPFRKKLARIFIEVRKKKEESGHNRYFCFSSSFFNPAISILSWQTQ